MQAGPEQLKDWMRRRGFTQADAARYIEEDEPTLSRLMTGKQVPGLRKAIRIERHTGIPVEAWAASELDDLGDDEPPKPRNRKVAKT